MPPLSDSMAGRNTCPTSSKRHNRVQSLRVPSSRQGIAASRRAFTLLEMVAYTGFLGIIAAVAMPMFRTTFRIMHDSAAKQSADVREDVALQQLRQDVWAARSIEFVSPQAIRIHMSSNESIAWDSDAASGSLTRRPEDLTGEQRWEGFARIEFATEGPTLVVRVAHDPGQSDETRSFMSQTMLLAGESR